MKHIVALCLLLAAAPVQAGDWKPLETTDEARQRQSAERHEIYQDRGKEAPLGGYRDRLGDPAPYGTERPGYNEPIYRPSGAGKNQ